MNSRMVARKHNAAYEVPKPELPAAVIQPARTAAEERDQLSMLAAANGRKGQLG